MITHDYTIHKIKSSKGETLIKPKDINDRFHQFYKELYSSKNNINHTTVKQFLDKCNLSQLDDEQAAQLNSEISVDEVRRAY